MIAVRWLGVVAVVCAAVVSGCGNSNAPARDASGSPSNSAPAGETSRVETASGAVRYLAIGDSLTQGVGASDEATRSFPALLAERWRAAGCHVELHNAGVSGSTVGQMITEQVPQIESFHPTTVTFQSGANDIVNAVPIEEYRQNIKTVLDAATGSGARVIVLAQNEWFRAPEGKNYGTNLAEQRAAYDAVMIEEAKARNAQFADLRARYKQDADSQLWVEDGIHPTPEVYEAWSGELANLVPKPCA